MSPGAPARAVLRRWAEPAAAGLIAAACLWIGLSAALSGAWLGWGLAALGLAAGLWARAALARARLDGGGEGPGVVQVDERRVAFFGPETGGIAALDQIEGLSAGRAPDGAPLWRLELDDGARLLIPADARGADRLAEAFAALPGFSPDRAAAAFADPAPGPRPIWRRHPAQVLQLPPRT